MYISAPQVSIDPTTAIVSAQRLSKVNFDKLLMAHQDSPLLEGARETVEKLVDESIRNLKKVDDWAASGKTSPKEKIFRI